MMNLYDFHRDVKGLIFAMQKVCMDLLDAFEIEKFTNFSTIPPQKTRSGAHSFHVWQDLVGQHEKKINFAEIELQNLNNS